MVWSRLYVVLWIIIGGARIATILARGITISLTIDKVSFVIEVIATFGLLLLTAWAIGFYIHSRRNQEDDI